MEGNVAPVTPEGQWWLKMRILFQLYYIFLYCKRIHSNNRESYDHVRKSDLNFFHFEKVKRILCSIINFFIKVRPLKEPIKLSFFIITMFIVRHSRSRFNKLILFVYKVFKDTA